MAYWSWQACDRDGNPLAELQALSDRRLAFFLNRPAVASASMDVSDGASLETILDPGVSELRVFRGGEEVPTFFRLSQVTIRRDGGSERAELVWDGGLSYLQDLLVVAGYSQSSTAQSEIAWDMINTAQGRAGADYGFTQGDQPNTDPTKSTTAEEDTELLAAIIALSERNDGFDFDVDAGRRFNVWYPNRGSALSVPFDSSVNVSGYEVLQDGGPGAIATDVRVRGGPGSTVQTGSDSDAQAVFRRREASIQYSGVISNNTVLSDYATRLAADRAAVNRAVQLTVDAQHPTTTFGRFWLGDSADVRLRSGSVLRVDGTFRVTSIEVGLSPADDETIIVGMDEQ